MRSLSLCTANSEDMIPKNLKLASELPFPMLFPQEEAWYGMKSDMAHPERVMHITLGKGIIGASNGIEFHKVEIKTNQANVLFQVLCPKSSIGKPES